MSHGRLLRWSRPGTHEGHTAVYLLVVLTAGAYLPSPLYPEYQAAFGFSDLMMTWVYAMFALVSAPTLLLFGPAADAVGPRTVLRVSVAVAAFASACFALAHDVGWLLAGRAAQGLALGTATGAATLVITEHTPVSRGRASVLASMAFVAGTAAGPIVAGALAQYAPGPRVLPYLVHLALLAIGWRLVSALPAPPRRARRWRPTRPRIPASMRLRFVAAAATGFLAWAVAGLFLAVIPSVLDRAARIDNVAVIGSVVGAVLLCSVLSQPFVARWGARLAQLMGLGALAISLVALAATGGGSLSITMVAAAAAGIGHGLAYGGAAASIEAVAPRNQRGAITSALYLAFYFGSGGPSVAVGLLTLWHPLDTAISWLGITAAVFVPLVCIAVVLTTRPATSSPIRYTASFRPEEDRADGGNEQPAPASRAVWQRKHACSRPRSSTQETASR
ncbi:MFS transporter [Saccharomonospora sp.]|uniref:MFS transporter n=1 Tax=Saccharomonospora sp. TaxID=33913 RepID=UPI002603291D|nr:MFS transporter [Saccharomonospora sp.]